MRVPLTRSEESFGDPAAGYPIAVVAARTGLSRDVLRVWERRYAAAIFCRRANPLPLMNDWDDDCMGQ